MVKRRYLPKQEEVVRFEQGDDQAPELRWEIEEWAGRDIGLDPPLHLHRTARRRRGAAPAPHQRGRHSGLSFFFRAFAASLAASEATDSSPAAALRPRVSPHRHGGAIHCQSEAPKAQSAQKAQGTPPLHGEALLADIRSKATASWKSLSCFLLAASGILISASAPDGKPWFLLGYEHRSRRDHPSLSSTGVKRKQEQLHLPLPRQE